MYMQSVVIRYLHSNSFSPLSPDACVPWCQAHSSQSWPKRRWFFEAKRSESIAWVIGKKLPITCKTTWSIFTHDFFSTEFENLLQKESWYTFTVQYLCNLTILELNLNCNSGLGFRCVQIACRKAGCTSQHMSIMYGRICHDSKNMSGKLITFPKHTPFGIVSPWNKNGRQVDKNEKKCKMPRTFRRFAWNSNTRLQVGLLHTKAWKPGGISWNHPSLAKTGAKRRA